MTLAHEANKLAQMAQDGTANEANIERLAVLTRRFCFMRCVAFARVSFVRWDDVDDATQLSHVGGVAVLAGTAQQALPQVANGAEHRQSNGTWPSRKARRDCS